ncbi:MAG: hypothetical protein Q8L02_07940 [Candidatus Nitrotoga sp.]|nr:hypothetical protein [Candidatus Nitrotoga sp.]
MKSYNNATFVEVPRQRNHREENAWIKEGGTSEGKINTKRSQNESVTIMEFNGLSSGLIFIITLSESRG